MDNDYGICETCSGRVFRPRNSLKWRHFKDDVLHPAKYRDPIMSCMAKKFSTGWCVIRPDGHERHSDGKWNWGGY